MSEHMEDTTGRQRIGNMIREAEIEILERECAFAQKAAGWALGLSIAGGLLAAATIAMSVNAPPVAGEPQVSHPHQSVPKAAAPAPSFPQARP